MSSLVYHVPPRSTSSQRTQRSASWAKFVKSDEANTKKLVHHVALEDNPKKRLPPDIVPLNDQIYDIAVGHCCFLPSQVRKEINILARRTIRASWYTEEVIQEIIPAAFTRVQGQKEIVLDARDACVVVPRKLLGIWAFTACCSNGLWPLILVSEESSSPRLASEISMSDSASQEQLPRALSEPHPDPCRLRGGERRERTHPHLTFLAFRR